MVKERSNFCFLEQRHQRSPPIDLFSGNYAVLQHTGGGGRKRQGRLDY